MVPTVLLCDRTDSQSSGLHPSMTFSVGRLATGYRTPSRVDNPANGGHGRGETKMKRFASLLSRAVLAALLLTCVFGGVARADDRGTFGPGTPFQADEIQLPEDPGTAF